MIRIDGSQGEGGGQVLRTSLTLSMLTGKSFRIDNIRSNRNQPGLKHQHLTAVQAAGKICGAAIEGDQLNSLQVVFKPGEIRSGSYRFQIATAGSAALVMQTLLIPLAHGEKSSRLVVQGGTHVLWSPCFHYLAWQWLPALEAIGYRAELTMKRAGYYPRGGGEITAQIEPVVGRNSLRWEERGAVREVRGLSGVSNLPLKISRRQRQKVVKELGARYPLNDIRTAEVLSSGKGSFLVLVVDCEGGRACFFSLGKPGKPAEVVGQETVNQILTWNQNGSVVDQYLPDQLLIPLALADGTSILRVTPFTEHLRTNAAVIAQFLETDFLFDESSQRLSVVTTGPV